MLPADFDIADTFLLELLSSPLDVRLKLPAPPAPVCNKGENNMSRRGNGGVQRAVRDIDHCTPGRVSVDQAHEDQQH
eukprot:3369371-Rhodomonas_salina.1